jgi:hypothetical protein
LMDFKTGFKTDPFIVGCLHFLKWFKLKGLHDYV